MALGQLTVTTFFLASARCLRARSQTNMAAAPYASSELSAAPEAPRLFTNGKTLTAVTQAPTAPPHNMSRGRPATVNTPDQHRATSETRR